MKVLLTRDANKLYSDSCAYADNERKIADAEYENKCLSEKDFRDLVFMETNNYVWLSNHELVGALAPQGKPRTLQDVVKRIVKEYDYDSPIKIFKHLSDNEPWFDDCFFMSARFDEHLLGELKIRDLNEQEKRDSPGALYYLEDGNHRALVYYMFIHLKLKEYKPVRAIWSKDWTHIFPWSIKP